MTNSSVEKSARPTGPNVGTIIKHMRLAKELTLKELAKNVGCSESLLSKIENGRTNPSLKMIQKVATALGTTVGDLFTQDDNPLQIVSYAGTRPMIQTDQVRRGQGLTLERMIPYSSGHLLQSNIHHIAPGGATEGPLHHNGEEFGLVLDGEIELTVGERTHFLRAGDSFCFRSEHPHSYRNSGPIPARVLWVNTPPTF